MKNPSVKKYQNEKPQAYEVDIHRIPTFAWIHKVVALSKS